MQKVDPIRSAKRILQQSVVHATKVYHQRRLEETAVSVETVEKLIFNAKDCFYGANAVPRGRYVDCVIDAMIENKIIDPDGAMRKYLKQQGKVSWNHEKGNKVPEEKANEVIEDLIAVIVGGSMSQADFRDKINKYYRNEAKDKIFKEQGDEEFDNFGVGLDVVLTVGNFGNL